MAEKKKKQLAFDVDTNIAKQILGEKRYTDIYSDIRRFLENRDWEHIEGSVYMSRYPLNTTDVAHDIYDMVEEHPSSKKHHKSR